MTCTVVRIFSLSFRRQLGTTLENILNTAYHSGLFLIGLLCLIIFGLLLWIMTVVTKGIYKESLWRDLVRSNPRYLCVIENRLECSGYKLDQCNGNEKQTSKEYCPGLFCVDFCRIGTSNVNVQPFCRSCGDDSDETVSFFLDCKSREKALRTASGCAELADIHLLAGYKVLMVGTAGTLVSIVLTLCISVYRYFFS